MAGRDIKELLLRLLTEGVFAAGAALSFILAYGFWVELATRSASPNSVVVPLCCPALASLVLARGAIHVLGKAHGSAIWDRKSATYLATGVILAALGIAGMPTLWR